MNKPIRVFICLLPVLLAGLAACAPASDLPVVTPSATRAGELTRYPGPTATSTLTPTNPATVTPLPSPTPTPRIHKVSRNEDMWGIALRYGISLDELMTANPTVNPRFLSVGIELVVPAPQFTPTPNPSNPPQPTPVGVSLETPFCQPGGEGGLWCFITVNNPQEFSVEGISAEIRLYDTVTGQIQSLAAYPPLNLLPPGGFLPLAVHFPAPIPATWEASAVLVSALPVPPDSGRYLTLERPNTEIEIAADGLSAKVTGEVQLSAADASASSVNLAAVAYDAQDRIVGLRRWEYLNLLSGTESLDYSLTVYSTGPVITRVVILAEAVPANNN